MNEIEAIKELQDSIDLPFGYVVSEEATKMAVNALEKQVPKKPRKTNSYRGIFRRIYAYVCPNCGNACLEKQANERQDTMFCWNCGKKLDWGDEE